MRFSFVLSVLALLGLLAAWTPVWATTYEIADTFVPNENCSTLGATHMAYDNTSLVICALANPNPSTSVMCGEPGTSLECKWKTMSQTSASIVGKTSGVYDGAGVGGYAGGHAKCAAQFGAGARMCAIYDLVNGFPPLGVGGWVNTFLPTTGGLFGGDIRQMDDCTAWTNVLSVPGEDMHKAVYWREDFSGPASEFCGPTSRGDNKHPILCCR
ncbi:MAG: hypothetical protein PHY92_10225 [Alphaproteobacteria bacterium]|nr:hypothetical protein [Alphaproteobacteria bacterium]